MNFHAAITDRKTGKITTYTQDTLDEYAARCVADGLCTKSAARTAKPNPAAGLKNWRDGQQVEAVHSRAIGYNKAWNPQAAAAGMDRIHTNSFVPVRLSKDEKDWLGRSVRFVGTGELRQFVPEGETEACGTVWSMAPGTRRCWVLTEDKRFALVYLDRLITD